MFEQDIMISRYLIGADTRSSSLLIRRSNTSIHPRYSGNRPDILLMNGQLLSIRSSGQSGWAEVSSAVSTESRRSGSRRSRRPRSRRQERWSGSRSSSWSGRIWWGRSRHRTTISSTWMKSCSRKRRISTVPGVDHVITYNAIWGSWTWYHWHVV